MKKLIFGLLLLGATSIMAQSPISPGQKQLNAGFGISTWGLPVYVGVDFGVAQDFSLGGVVSYRGYNDGFGDWSIMTFGMNGNYHFDNLLDLSSDWNVYGGLTLGYYVWNTPNGYTGNQNSGLGLDAQIGTRYFFSKSFAANLELGGGTIGGGKLGITKKF
jgi:outer membrane immunogenic protein